MNLVPFWLLLTLVHAIGCQQIRSLEVTPTEEESSQLTSDDSETPTDPTFVPTNPSQFAVGIPTPPFGIDESHADYTGTRFDFDRDGSLEEGEDYRDAGNGPYTHYVDRTVACNDSNNSGYGSPSTPLCRVPTDLPAGSVVEIHGTDYDYGNYESSKLRFSGTGTAQAPIFIRGVDENSRPLFRNRETHIEGRYLILENLSFYRSKLGILDRIGSGARHQSASSIAVRYSRLQGDGLPTGGAAINIGAADIEATPIDWVRNVVIYQNEISDYGDWQPEAENDVMGVTAGVYAENVWILENHIHHLGGDSIRTGTNPAGGITVENTARFVYVGRNHFHHNGENAVDIKVCRNIVLSENSMHDFVPSISSAGEAVVVHYSPDNIWLINNVIYNSAIGAISTGSDGFYLIGNLFFDNTIAVRARSTPFLHMVHNTIVDNGTGLHTQQGMTAIELENNIFGSIHDPETGFHVRIENSATANNSTVSESLFYQPSGTIHIDWGGSETSTLLEFQSDQTCIGCIQADPSFMNEAVRDYRISSSSVARNAGSDTLFTTIDQAFFSQFGIRIVSDAYGTERPCESTVDIGAFEFCN